MESDVSHSATLWKLYAWADARKKQLAYALIGAVVVALVIGYIVWQRAEKEDAASHALATVHMRQLASPMPSPDAAGQYLKVAEQHPNTDAAVRALLLAASAQFVQGNYAEAQSQFQKFARDHTQSPLVGQALLGVAASLDAQNKTNEAATAYQQLIERRPNDSVTPQARFALARIYEAQGKPQQAKTLFEEITRNDPYGSLGSEAGIRLEELLAKHPELKTAPIIGTNAVPAPGATGTNAAPLPVPAPAPAPAPAASGTNAGSGATPPAK